MIFFLSLIMYLNLGFAVLNAFVALQPAGSWLNILIAVFNSYAYFACKRDIEQRLQK